MVINDDVFLPESIVIELFGDVVFAVGILERQVELVRLGQRRVASRLIAAWTAESSAFAVHVDRDMLTQLLNEFVATISCNAVRDEPRHETALPGRVVAGGPPRSSRWRGGRRWTGPLPGGRLERGSALKAGEGHVLVVRRDDGGVAAVCRRPVDESFSVAELGRVDGRLEQPQDPDLSARLAVASLKEGITTEKSHVGSQFVPGLGRQHTGVHGATVLNEPQTTGRKAIETTRYVNDSDVIGIV